MADVTIQVVDPVTAGVVAIMNAAATLFTAISATQTPAQREKAWDQYFSIVGPLVQLIVRIEKLAVPDPSVSPGP